MLRTHNYRDNRTFTLLGVEFAWRTQDDETTGAPWKEHDGHGEVRSANKSYGSRVQKRPGERVMSAYRHDVTLYDWQDAIRKAKDEGWGLGDEELAEFTVRCGRKPTARMIRAEAVRRDFEYLAGWARSDWHWVDVLTWRTDDDGEVEPADIRYSGSYESTDTAGHLEAAHESAVELLDDMRAAVIDAVGLQAALAAGATTPQGAPA